VRDHQEAVRELQEAVRDLPEAFRDHPEPVRDHPAPVRFPIPGKPGIDAFALFNYLYNAGETGYNTFKEPVSLTADWLL